MMVRFYQRISKSTQNNEGDNGKTTNQQTNREPKSLIFNIFPSQTFSRFDSTDSSLFIDANLQHSFTLIGECVMNNLLPLNNWNFLTISVNWKSSELGLITWLINENVLIQSKFSRSSNYAFQGSPNIESFMAIGQVGMETNLSYQYGYNLGSLFIFEGTKLQTDNDNLSLMFLSQNWDGGSIMMNSSERESSKVLGTVIMRILVDRQISSDLGSVLLKRGQNILENRWAEKMNDLISNFLVDSFSCGNIGRFEINQLYIEDSEFVSAIFNYNQIPSIGFSKSRKEELSTSGGKCFNKYFLTKNSIDSAVENLGGVRLFVFWLAKTVENNDEISSRWILKLMLLLIRKSIFLAYQNIQEKGYSDLLQIFKSFKMKLNYEIISDLVQHMTYEDLIRNKSTPLNSKLCRDPHILHELLIQWKILATSKLNASRNEISMSESQALVLDKYLLHQINSLLSEDNVYSIINCSSLEVMGMLSPLLMACQEPFDALEHPLPPEICEILLQIINNLIPTSVDLNIIVKLCNTILQLFPVSMKDNDINNGRYYRHLKAFTDIENDTQCIDPQVNDDFEKEVVSENRNTEVNSNDKVDNQFSVSLLESKVSEVEKKTLQQFYYSTLSDNPLLTNETNDLMEIELSTESSTSQQSSCHTLIDGNDNNFVNTSFETTFITSTNLTEKPIIRSHCESSRVKIIAGLISILENVIEVKVSDSVLEKCSIQDFCFEFILHLLSHSCASVRQKSLSLFRVFLYRRKSLVQQTNNQPSMINMVSHVIYQNTTTKEILAEAISIIFGQNLLKIIMDIDWENHSNVKISNHTDHYESPYNNSTDPINPICKLHGIISNQPEMSNVNSSLDEFINTSSNHFGLFYRRSAVLLQSILSNMEYDSILWALKLASWLFINNNVLLQACLKTGLLEFICNYASMFLKELVSKNDPKLEAFVVLCRIVAVNITMSSTNIQFYKLLELCDILHVACLKATKQTIKCGNFNNEIIVHYVLQNILISIIETVCIINSEDPAFSIQPQNFYIQKIVIKYRLLTHHFASQKMLNEKLAQTINVAIGIIINTQKCIYSYYFELCKLMGLNLVNYSMTIVSNCLACNQTPDEYSIFLGCKEIIKSNLGDLIVCLTHSKFSLDFRLDVVECIFKFENFNRVVRYCLLGNSSGSLCMVINIKQILNYVKQLPNISNDLVNNISILLSVASIDFPVENLDEDSRSLWINDCELKHNKWKEKFKKKLSIWNENADRNFNEVSIQMKNSYNNYRSYARKNLQQEYFSNIRNQRAAEFFRRRSWKVLTNNLTHEKAIWENVNKRSQIYRLDPTEGPSRIRRRMIKTSHKLHQRFFNLKKEEKGNNSSDNDLSFLFESTYHVDKMVFESPIDCQLLKCIEDVRISCPCIWVSLSGHFKGEFFVGSSRIGFLEDRNNNHYCEYDELPIHLKDFGFINWALNEIEWLFKRRFKLRDCALEMIMKDGRNCLIAMNSTQERDNIVTYIEASLPSSANKKQRLIDMESRWLNGEISNFDYLVYLNTAAGRSYNDIMQYPVFPFILTDYSSSILDLTKESTFRDLSKPISIQKSELREKVVNSFIEKKEEYQRQLHLLQTSSDSDEMSVWAVPPYHYSSLYSNTATVLYYMIRVPPFTQKFIQFQDGEFDRPDRLFHTLSSAWNLSTSSVSCMKEIIPEFFYLPEMFINSQDFKFGERLNGVKVDDVILPKWCSGDARLFCLIHRASLESPYVSNQLNHWIDLIFGFKQTGKSALEAINLFHPYTYYKAISPDDIVNTIRRHAVEQMIENYGQISKQLFQIKAHPAKKINWKHFKMSSLKRSQSTVTIDKEYLDVDSVKDPSDSSYESIKPLEKDKKYLIVLNGVHGIDWGDWVGSPDNSQTFINDIHKKKEKLTCKLFLLPMTKLSMKKSLKLLVIPRSSNVLMLPITVDGNQPIIKFTITPNKRRIQVDSILYGSSSSTEIQSENIGSFLVSNGSGQAFVTSITISQRSGRVFFGMESGLIEVYQGDMSKYSQIESFVNNFTKYWKTLLGHKTAVTQLVMGESFAVLASCDSQNNVAIWESQTLELIHYIDWLSVKYVPSSKKLNTQSCSSSNPEEFLHTEILPIQSDSVTTISAMCFSETLGDLVISRLMRQKIVNYQTISNISLFTINGKHVDSIMLSGMVVSLSYTNLTEGRHVNAIAAITNEGRLTVMSSWNLQVVWKVKIPTLYQSDHITSIQYTHSGRELYAIHESGHVQVLQSNRPDLNSRQYVYFWI